MEITTDLLRPDERALLLDEAAGPVLHRDLADIASTEADGITINRTKGGLSPFVPIVKTPTYAANSGNHTGYAVEVADPDAESGFRHVGNVSAGYLLLPNADVRALALEIAEASGLAHRESRIFWDGRRFAHVVDFEGAEEEVSPGDRVGLSLVTRNSYDKSWRFECALMGKRFACDNGMLSGEFFARVSFRHRAGAGEEEAWADVVRAGLAVVHRAPGDLRRFAGGLRRLKATPTTDERLRAIWRRIGGLGDGTLGRIVSRYVEAEEPTLYGLLNAGTHVLWHNRKLTSADFANNDAFVTALLDEGGRGL